MSRPQTYKKRYEAALCEIQHLRGIIYSAPSSTECTCGRPFWGEEHDASCKRAIVRRRLRDAVDGREMS